MACPRWRKLTLQTVALLLLAIVLLLRYSGNFLAHPPFLMDFEVYRTVALRVLHGQADQLYAPTYSSLALFKYAPVWAFAWVPFAVLSSHAGSVLWTTVSVAAFIAACALTQRVCRLAGLSSWAWAPIAATLLLTRVLNEEFLNGQTDTVWVLLMVLGVYGVLANRLWLGAISFALAISLKLPALLFVAYFLLTRRWKLAGQILAYAAVFNVAGSWCLAPQAPWKPLATWLQTLAASAPTRAFEIGAQSFVALCTRYLTADAYPLHLVSMPGPVAVGLALLVEVALFGWLVVSSRARQSRVHLVLDSAMLILMAALFSPTAWLATYTVLVAPLLIAMSLLATRLRRILRDAPSGVLLLAVLMMSWLTHRKAWLLFGIKRIASEEYVFLVVMTAPWFALALLAWLGRQRRVGFPDA